MRPRHLGVLVAIVGALALRGSAGERRLGDAATHRERGLAALSHADYRTAGEELESARAGYARAGDRRDAAQMDLSLAYAAESRADWDGLRRHATAARDAFAALGDRAGQVRALRQLSRDPTLASDRKEALLEAAVDLARPAANPGLLGEVLVERGDLHFREGNYAAALADLQPALARFEASGERQQLARALVSLGRVYRAHGEPERALPLYQRALGMQEASGDTQGAIQSVNAIAVTEDLLGRRAEALREYEHALSLARRTGASRLIAFQLGNLGGAYLKRDDYPRAIDLLQSALRQPNDPVVKAIRQSQLAEAYRKIGRPRDALPLDDEVVAFDREQHREDALIEDLTERGRARGDLGDTAAALSDVREALAALETVRAHLVPSDVMKQGFTRLYQDTYDAAIDLLARRNDATAALETSEEARSRALLDLLASRDLHVAAAPASSAEVERTARRLRSTLLLYFVTPDATFAWVVTADRVRLHRIRIAEQRLAELVARTRPAHAENAAWSSGETATAWRQLYRILVQPLRGDLPQARGSLLTIVPHGPLFGLSFAGLHDASGRFLLEDYTLHYAPSVAVLRFTQANAAAVAGPPRYLLVADPPSDNGSSGSAALPPLPGARAEVRAVADIVPTDRQSLLVGAATTVSDVRARMQDATVIHLATHAIASDADPLESFLALDGGRLTAADIYRLHLEADLVVLSACRTALGPVTGDGVAGLTRAFVYAGTSSVIATMWDVADGPTVRLMREFYRDRLAGADKADALRAAQLRLLADLRAGRLTIDEPDGTVTLRPDPYFWAGFVLVGEP